MPLIPEKGISGRFLFSCYLLLVAAAATVVLITAAVIVLVAASVIACEYKNKDDEKDPIAVASVTEEHSNNLLSHLPLHNMKDTQKSAGK